MFICMTVCVAILEEALPFPLPPFKPLTLGDESAVSVRSSMVLLISFVKWLQIMVGLESVLLKALTMSMIYVKIYRNPKEQRQKVKRIRAPIYDM